MFRVARVVGRYHDARMWTPDLEVDLALLLDELVAVRRDLHQHPELGFEETRTQAKVRTWLERFGLAPRDCAETGLVADLRAAPEHSERRLIALRADLDCLPMQEDTPLPYRSVHAGRAHKCGHDGHTTILMGAAALLAKHRAHLPHDVRFLFQPAEEGIRGGGARVMVREGALEGVDEVYALHNWPGFPLGEVRVQPGSMMAHVHTFHIRVTGRGGHGSQPQVCRDPIVAASALVTALQTLVSRGLGYEGGAVVSVGRFSSGTVENVIPSVAELSGTIRTFDPAITARVLERLDEVATGTAATYGVEVATELIEGYPVVVNDQACAQAVAEVAAHTVGGARVSSTDLPLAAAEDFAYMTEATRGAYFLLGAGRTGEDTPGCHHPDFDFEDDLIPTGVRMFVGLALRPSRLADAPRDEGHRPEVDARRPGPGAGS